MMSFMHWRFHPANSLTIISYLHFAPFRLTLLFLSNETIRAPSLLYIIPRFHIGPTLMFNSWIRFLVIPRSITSILGRGRPELSVCCVLRCALSPCVTEARRR